MRDLWVGTLEKPSFRGVILESLDGSVDDAQRGSLVEGYSELASVCLCRAYPVCGRRQGARISHSWCSTDNNSRGHKGHGTSRMNHRDSCTDGRGRMRIVEVVDECYSASRISDPEGYQSVLIVV